MINQLTNTPHHELICVIIQNKGIKQKFKRKPLSKSFKIRLYFCTKKKRKNTHIPEHAKKGTRRRV